MCGVHRGGGGDRGEGEQVIYKFTFQLFHFLSKSTRHKQLYCHPIISMEPLNKPLSKHTQKLPYSNNMHGVTYLT